MYKVDTRKLFEIGDILYKISRLKCEGPFEIKIVDIKHYEFGHYFYKDNFNNDYSNKNLNKTIFKTKEEALKALEDIKKANKKRKLLKEYEAKLNKELQLENHIIVK